MIRAEIQLIARKTEFFLELEQRLTLAGIAVAWAADTQKEIPSLEIRQAHMVVLDCPKGQEVSHGLTMSQKIRDYYSGLLVLVSGQENSDFHSLALSLGIDASFTYTAGPSLLDANIQALLRRFVLQQPSPQLIFGNLTIDPGRRDAFVAGQALELSTIEFQLLWALAQKPGCAVSREEIHQNLYKTAYNGYDRSIDLYVSRIRQKIGDYSECPHCVKTVRGIGYQFIAVGNG